MIIRTNNELETTQLGKTIGKLMNENTTLYLYGEMASGKTQLARGVAEALGMLRMFSSPTYTIINEYENDGDTLYHMDAYRLEDVEELDYVGFDDIYKNKKMIIEWPEIIKDNLEETGVVIRINKTDEDFNVRNIEIKAFEDSMDIVKQLEEVYE